LRKNQESEIRMKILMKVLPRPMQWRKLNCLQIPTKGSLQGTSTNPIKRPKEGVLFVENLDIMQRSVDTGNKTT
jgi:hypothetical protein